MHSKFEPRVGVPEAKRKQATKNPHLPQAEGQKRRQAEARQEQATGKTHAAHSKKEHAAQKRPREPQAHAK